MNKLILKLIPYILICLIFIYDHMFPYKNLMVVGIILLFPIIFIFQGIIYSSSIKEMIISFTFSYVIMMIFFYKWYFIPDIFTLTRIYVILGIISFTTKKIIDSIKKNKKIV